MALPEDKLAYTVDELSEAGGGSRSDIYEALRRGALTAKKRGRRTIILRSIAVAYLASLPDYAPKAEAA